MARGERELAKQVKQKDKERVRRERELNALMPVEERTSKASEATQSKRNNAVENAREALAEGNVDSLSNRERDLHTKILEAHNIKNDAAEMRYEAGGVINTLSAKRAAQNLDFHINNLERYQTTTKLASQAATGAINIGKNVGKGLGAAADLAAKGAINIGNTARRGLGAGADLATAIIKPGALAQRASGGNDNTIQQEGGSYNRHCHYRSAQMMEGLMNAALTSSLKESFPYSWWEYPQADRFATWGPAPEYKMVPQIAYPERPSPWSAAGFQNYIARMIAGNYCFMRSLIIQFMSIFGRENDAAKTAINSDTTLMFISWLHLALITVITPIISMLSTMNLAWNSFWMWTYRNDPKSKIEKAAWRDETAAGGCCEPPYAAMQKAKKLAMQKGGDGESDDEDENTELVKIILDNEYELGYDSDLDYDGEGGGMLGNLKAKAQAAKAAAGKKYLMQKVLLAKN